MSNAFLKWMFQQNMFQKQLLHPDPHPSQPFQYNTLIWQTDTSETKYLDSTLIPLWDGKSMADETAFWEACTSFNQGIKFCAGLSSWRCCSGSKFFSARSTAQRWRIYRNVGIAAINSQTEVKYTLSLEYRLLRSCKHWKKLAGLAWGCFAPNHSKLVNWEIHKVDKLTISDSSHITSSLRWSKMPGKNATSCPNQRILDTFISWTTCREAILCVRLMCPSTLL